MANTRFILNETSYFGFGAREVLLDELKDRGYKRVFLVSDKSLVDAGVTDKVMNILEEGKVRYELYDDVKPNPSIDNVLHGYKKSRWFRPDVILAVGGGSSMDTAKAISILMTNPDRDDVVSLNGPSNTKKKGLPMIAMPTTAGTAAMGFSNVGLGIVHSMAHQLGAVYDTPHGLANAILLPTVLEFNGAVCADLYKEILTQGMGINAMKFTDEEAVKTLCEKVRDLSEAVGITQTVKDVGAKKKDFAMLADKAMEDPCKPGNPREVTKQDFIDLYEKAW